MASVITATTTSGLTQSADNSGVLQLASGTGNLVTVPSVTGTAMVSGNMPAFSAYRGSSNQSISSATWTKVQLNTEEFDTANCFDSTTNYRFTANVAGYYQFSGAIAFGGTVGRSLVSFWKNGSEYKTGIDLTASVIKLNTSALIYLNGTTDYVELYGYCVGSSLTFESIQTSTYMTGVLVRGA